MQVTVGSNVSQQFILLPSDSLLRTQKKTMSKKTVDNLSLPCTRQTGTVIAHKGSGQMVLHCAHGVLRSSSFSSQGRPGRSSTARGIILFHLSLLFPKGAARWSFTARIEGAHSDRAASASKGDHSGRPLSLPSLILLDWHLGKQRGDEFLKRLRADARLAAIPVVVFTTSDDHHDLSLAYANGANGYVVKPGTFAELIQCTGDLCRYWMDRNRIPHMIGTPC